MDVQISGLLAESCSDLLAAYGVRLVPSQMAWTPKNEPLFCGVIGFVGKDVRGTCLIAADYEVVRVSCPAGASLRDWVGELANQLVGRLKAKLLERGVDVALTTPLAFSDVQLQPSPRRAAEPRVFLSDVGLVLAWLEIELGPSFKLGSPHPLDTHTGDVLFF